MDTDDASIHIVYGDEEKQLYVPDGGDPLRLGIDIVKFIQRIDIDEFHTALEKVPWALKSRKADNHSIQTLESLLQETILEIYENKTLGDYYYTIDLNDKRFSIQPADGQEESKSFDELTVKWVQEIYPGPDLKSFEIYSRKQTVVQILYKGVPLYHSGSIKSSDTAEFVARYQNLYLMKTSEGSWKLIRNVPKHLSDKVQISRRSTSRRISNITTNDKLAWVSKGVWVLECVVGTSRNRWFIFSRTTGTGGTSTKRVSFSALCERYSRDSVLALYEKVKVEDEK